MSALDVAKGEELDAIAARAVQRYTGETDDRYRERLRLRELPGLRCGCGAVWGPTVVHTFAGGSRFDCRCGLYIATDEARALAWKQAQFEEGLRGYVRQLEARIDALTRGER